MIIARTDGKGGGAAHRRGAIADNPFCLGLEAAILRAKMGVEAGSRNYHDPGISAMLAVKKSAGESPEKFRATIYIRMYTLQTEFRRNGTDGGMGDSSLYLNHAAREG